MKKFIAVAGLLFVFVSLSAPILVSAQQPSPAKAVVGSSSGSFCANLTEGLPKVVSCVIMISSEEKRQQGKDTIMYGVIGLFIMISVWGLVAILDSTFNLADESPSTYTSDSLIR